MIKEILLNLTQHFSVSASHARIGIVQYSTIVRTVFTLQRSQKLGFHKLKRKIERMPYIMGGTKTGKGLSTAYKMLRSSKRELDGEVVKHDQVS